MSPFVYGIAAVWILAVVSVWALLYAHGEREKKEERRVAEGRID